MMKKRSQGFSLIEVLVSVLIMAVGILGVAGMQVLSLQQNRNALLRDQALQAGNDILDRMRANPLSTYAPTAITDAPSANLNCVTSSCDRNEMAAFDIAQWKCRLNPFDTDGAVYQVCTDFNILTSSLPGGQGSITKDALLYTVTVTWVRDQSGNTSTITLRAQTESS
ncbi:MAG: type IV pilus assembly protein PilV [Candidatus Azotimanducaceae bacterium]|jgi:type IV pilus assembly protein PilV